MVMLLIRGGSGDGGLEEILRDLKLSVAIPLNH